jgi:thiol-disulfide isomerase/thioredoxin
MARWCTLRLGLVAALAVGAAACGGGSTTTADAPATSAPSSTTTTSSSGAEGVETTSTSAATGSVDLPSIPVVDLSTGDEVDLASLARAGTPTLLWFWAPHCTFCRREAPELIELVQEHGGDLPMIGIGAQDSLEEAYGFLDDTDTHDLRMIWDPSGDSWVHHGVTSQPTVIVLGADGEVAGTWYRDFDPDGILRAAGLA